MTKPGWVAASAAGVLIIALVVVAVVTWDGGRSLRPILATAALAAVLLAVMPVLTRRIIRAELRRERDSALRDAAVNHLTRGR